MEESSSVNIRGRRSMSSPPKNPSDDVSLSEAGDRSPAGFKLSEVYGFVGSITIGVATVIFIVWAYVPDYWLHHVGIYYHPNRYWTLPVPTYVLFSIILAIGLYVGLNFTATPPPTSLKAMFDEMSEELLSDINDAELAIESVSDIGTNQVSDVFNNLK